MTLSQDEFREQLLDYLYGSLSPEQRAAFEASLAGSEAYQKELAATRAALQLAREGLAGLAAAEPEPPAAVRKALLEHAARDARQSQTAAKGGRSIGSRCLAWLQSPPRLAALGALAVIALALLSRQRAPQPAVPPVLRERAPAAQERAAPARPLEREAPPSGTPAQTPGGSGPSEADAPASADGLGTGRPLRAPGSGPRKPSPRRAEPPAKRRTRSSPAQPAASSPARPRAEQADRLQQAAQPQRTGQADRAHDADDASRAGAAFPRAPAAKSTSRALPDTRPDAHSAPPPTAAPPAAEAYPRDREDEASTRPAAAQRSFIEDSTRGASPAAAPRVAPPAAAREARGFAQAPRAAEDAAAALDRRAQAHLAAGRLREAAEAYEQLLRRFPGDPRAETWRKQLQRARAGLRAPAP